MNSAYEYLRTFPDLIPCPLTTNADWHERSDSTARDMFKAFVVMPSKSQSAQILFCFPMTLEYTELDWGTWVQASEDTLVMNRMQPPTRSLRWQNTWETETKTQLDRQSPVTVPTWSEATNICQDVQNPQSISNSDYQTSHFLSMIALLENSKWSLMLKIARF